MSSPGPTSQSRKSSFGYPSGAMKRLALVCAMLAYGLEARAEPVRVVIAAEVPRVAIAGAASYRAQLASSLITARFIEPWGDTPVFAAEIDSSELASLRADPRVRAISLDVGGAGALVESGPLVGANLVHAQGFDGRGVTIAILDTGIDAQHRDFAGRVIAQQCFCDNRDGTGCCPDGETMQSGSGSAHDDNGHGTHVAGIAAGGGVAAARGMAPGARIVAVKVLDRANRFVSFTQIYRGLEWIATARPDVSVVNMSLGTWSLYSPYDCADAAIAIGIRDVLDRLRARGVVVAVSSGNQASSQTMGMPACMDEVLSVGATYDRAGAFDFTTAFGCTDAAGTVDGVACFSNSSPSLDLLAPGAVIQSSRPGGSTAQLAGTSMAAPHVAGAVALMQQAGGRLPPPQIADLLRVTGTPLYDPRNGVVVPRLDVARAVAATPKLPPNRRRPARH